MASNPLQSTIMRRVYYAFFIHCATHPITLYLAALVALAWWLKELVFVARIWESVISRPVSELGSFAVGLVQGADALTLGVAALLLVCAGALMHQLRRVQHYSYTSYAL